MKIGPGDESNALSVSLVPLLGDQGLGSTAMEIDRNRILLVATSSVTFTIIVTKIHLRYSWQSEEAQKCNP